ncbi:hypothetical protein GCM10027290_62500 [Micromonospora sonneratiae]|jgi:hypothetical protein|uniref:Tat (Twin-arginine translocation) pathway signal sequence n=1 Tax=Micromonospora sonneratiae TaxID=1184706 RepID=A0ABW3YIN4_9ACTN
MSHARDDRSLSRRGLLRRGATVAAATAGATVVGATALPSAAQAAPGDDMLMGTTNTAQPQSTSLTSTSGEATLVLANSEGAPLRLVPTPLSALSPALRQQPAGAVAIDEVGDICVRGGDPGQEFNSWAWTTQWATTSVAVPPTRVIDTRDPAQRANIVSGIGNLDATGRIKGGTSIVVSLDAYVKDGLAMKGNVTVVGTTSAGYVTVWGSGARPVSSTLNWWGANQILSNFVFTAFGQLGTARSVVAIYAHTPTQVILDLTSLVVRHPAQVRIGAAAKAAAQLPAAQLPAATPKRGDLGAPQI